MFWTDLLPIIRSLDNCIQTDWLTIYVDCLLAVNITSMTNTNYCEYSYQDS